MTDSKPTLVVGDDFRFTLIGDPDKFKAEYGAVCAWVAILVFTIASFLLRTGPERRWQEGDGFSFLQVRGLLDAANSQAGQDARQKAQCQCG